MARPALTQASLDSQRARISTTAMQLFETSGLQAVTLRTIAPQVELTPMALYRYFPRGQPEIVASIRAGGFLELARVLDRAAASDGDPLDRVVAMLGAVVRFGVAQGALYKLMFDLTQPDFEEEGQPLREARRSAWASPERVFREAVEAKLLTGDPTLLPHLFFAGIHGVVHFELSRQTDRRRTLDTLLAPMIGSLLLAHGVSARRIASLQLDRIHRSRRK